LFDAVVTLLTRIATLVYELLPHTATHMQYRNPLKDSWGSVGLWTVGPGTVTLMNMCCVAFMAHYNGVKYYEELEVQCAEVVVKYAVLKAV
jgi:hypothetical protein